MTDQLPDDPDELRQLLADTRDELDRLRLTLEVVGTMDLDAGILNRNGVLESLERGRRWMARRGDIYGAVVVSFPHLRTLDVTNPDDLELVKHLAATIGAAVREVDEVGRIDELTFASTLADIKPGSIQVVADRIVHLLDAVIRSEPTVRGFRIGAVEVLNAGHTSGTVLDACIRMAERATPGTASVGQI
jgi:hypothetical protein